MEIEVIRACRRINPATLPGATALLASLDLIPLSGTVIDEAANAGATTLRSLNALHLADALAIRAQRTAFIAYDHRLTEAAATAGLELLTPGARSLAARVTPGRVERLATPGLRDAKLSPFRRGWRLLLQPGVLLRLIRVGSDRMVVRRAHRSVGRFQQPTDIEPQRACQRSLCLRLRGRPRRQQSSARRS